MSHARTFALPVVLILLSISTTHTARACSCSHVLPPVEQEFDTADAVFLGRVIERAHCWVDLQFGPDACPGVERTFHVDLRWKGPVEGIVRVRADDCVLFSAEPGDLVLVYARIDQQDDLLYFLGCGRSTRTRWAQEAGALEALGFDPEVLYDVSSTRPPPPLFNLPCGAGLLPFALGTGMVMAVSRLSSRGCRRRRSCELGLLGGILDEGTQQDSSLHRGGPGGDGGVA